ncbi:MAG TPA: tetratricopeptide repeat-containing glycosyltransferase family protein [Rhodopila sp.]|nr:tetratricopeptide repeat-containing glycosyltransferase family protein [Rhodopila sp.]
MEVVSPVTATAPAPAPATATVTTEPGGLARLERPDASPPSRAGEIMVPVPLGELFTVAAQYERSGKMQEADRLLNHILAVAPHQPDSLHMSGIVAFRLGRQQEAVRKMEEAIARGVDIALYLRNICEVYRTLNRLDDAVAAARRAVSLSPSDPLCLHNLSVIHYERVEIDAAIEAAERALEMNPDLAGAHFARAEGLLIKGDWERGWEEYEWRFRIADAARMMPATDKPQWDGKPFADGTLLMVADQGFGDVIQFSRYIPWVLERCPDVVVAGSSEMVPVLRQFLPEEKIFFRWEDCPTFKSFIPLSGLPRLHGTRVDNVPTPIPYLHADPARVAHWKERLRRLVPGTQKRIGIVWAGRPTHNNDRRRSSKLADFAPLAALPGLALVSLQKGPSADQAGRYFGRAPLINIGAEVRDYNDTMALLECLDLVVTVDTSVGHLAAAMGKPVWILLATSPDWRWLLNRSDTAWYPSVRLFRQTVPRQWSDVFKAVAAALAKEVSGEAVLPPAKLPETPVRPETGTAGASGRAVQRKPRRRPAEPAADA